LYEFRAIYAKREMVFLITRGAKQKEQSTLSVKYKTIQGKIFSFVIVINYD